jgi:heat-inducible transcriptional repressor
MIPERSLEVLKAIVQDYVATREPVGSKALLERHAFGVSSATIRNDMALLEDEDLIHAPHTSSGRVPTDKGYRLFVDRLNEVKPLSSPERQAIETFISDSADLDEILGKTVRLLSQLTNQVAMVQYPSLGRAQVRHIELISASETRVLVMLITNTGRVQQHIVELGSAIDSNFLTDLRDKLNHRLSGLHLSMVSSSLEKLAETVSPENNSASAKLFNALLDLVDANSQEKLIMAGTATLVRREEDFAGQVAGVLDAIEEQVVLLRLISELQTEQYGVTLRIGKENPVAGLSTSTLLVSGYESQNGEIAKLGVIGPTRMDYQTNIAAVKAVAKYLTNTFTK